MCRLRIHVARRALPNSRSSRPCATPSGSTGTSRGRSVSRDGVGDVDPNDSLDPIARTGRHLDEAQRTLAETEAIGAWVILHDVLDQWPLTVSLSCVPLLAAGNVANNLMVQRNQFEHAQMNVRVELALPLRDLLSASAWH